MSESDIIRKLKKELELKTQDLYDAQRENRRLYALEKDYLLEIDNIQKDKSAQEEQYKMRILQLEEEVVATRTELNEKILSLESELLDKVTDLEMFYSEKKQKDISSICDCQTKEALLDELHEVKELNEDLQQKIEQTLTTHNEFQKENNLLISIQAELKKEINVLKENLEIKRNELEEANNLINSLQADMCNLNMEIASIKSKPLDEQSRGNSLFAEVNDRRIFLEETIEKMKVKYNQMKQEHAAHLELIKDLRLQNLKLTELVDIEINQKATDESSLSRTQQITIKTLQSVIEGYEKDMAKKIQQVEKFSVSEMDFMEKMLNTERLETEKLRKGIRSISVNNSVYHRDLLESNRENRGLKLEILKLQNEIAILKNTIREIEGEKMGKPEDKLVDSPPQPNSVIEEETVALSINGNKVNKSKKVVGDVKNLSNISLKTEDLKNLPRRVQFDENTKKVDTGSCTLPKGVKVIKPQPFKY